MADKYIYQIQQIRIGFQESKINEFNTHYLEGKIIGTKDSEGKFEETDLTDLGWFKLGIQASPGSKWKINTKEILIGRTGIYELDEDIIVTSLEFIDGEETNIIIDYVFKEVAQ